MVLKVHNLARAFGAVTVLHALSFVVNPRDRLGVVGSNGAGKSTLLRILAGHDTADGGTFAFAPGIEIGYVPQALPEFGDQTIADVIGEAVGGLRQIATRLRDLEAIMATAQDGDLAGALEEYGHLATRFQDRGGYDLDHRIDAILAGLRVAHLGRGRLVRTLSGGEKSRVNLAAILLCSPDLLLLDEPTNHLDFALAAWLEDYLAHYPGAVVVVSHDRHFLNRVVTQIAEIDEHTHGMNLYAGAYDAYAAAKTAERAKWREDFDRQQEEIKDLRRRIREAAKPLGHNRLPKDNDKFIYYAKGQNVDRAKARNIHAAEDHLARIAANPIPNPPKSFRINPHFRNAALRSDAVLRVEHLTKGYDGRTILDDVSFAVAAEDRIMLVAPNGAGKTTLLRLLLGLEAPDAGTIRTVGSAQIGYLPQDPDLPDSNKTVLQAYADGLVGLDEQFIAGLIGYGLFRLEDVARTVGQLSLGQRRKLEIAKLLAAHPNILILDEPSNYLSLDVLEAFEEAVLAFAGPVIAVSHDRWFIERFGGAVWSLDEGRLVRMGEGDGVM